MQNILFCIVNDWSISGHLDKMFFLCVLLEQSEAKYPSMTSWTLLEYSGRLWDHSKSSYFRSDNFMIQMIFTTVSLWSKRCVSTMFLLRTKDVEIWTTLRKHGLFVSPELGSLHSDNRRPCRSWGESPMDWSWRGGRVSEPNPVDLNQPWPVGWWNQ